MTTKIKTYQAISSTNSKKFYVKAKNKRNALKGACRRSTKGALVWVGTKTKHGDWRYGSTNQKGHKCQ